MTQRLKPTKRPALQVANMLELGALAPDEDLDWHAVREVTESITGEGQLDFFPARPPDRLDAQDRRRAFRLASGASHRQIAGPVAASTKRRIPATSRSTAEAVADQARPRPHSDRHREEPGNADRQRNNESSIGKAPKPAARALLDISIGAVPSRPLPPTALAAAKFTTCILRQTRLERRFVSRSRQRRPRIHSRHWRRQRRWR